MNKKIKVLYLMLVVFIGCGSVSAKELQYENNDSIKFVNNNGLNITESIYEKLRIYDYTEEEISNLSVETYNYINNIKIDSYSKSEKYFEDTYIYKSQQDYEQKLSPVKVVSKEISKLQYDGKISGAASRALNSDGSIYETSARKTVMVIGYWTDTPTTKNISIQTTFKTIPSTRSYDLIALRITNGEINANSQHMETQITYRVPTAACDGIYTTQTSTATATHTSSGFNTKSLGLGYYGVGFTGLLPNDYINCYNDLSVPFYQTLTGYKITMYANAKALGGNTINLYGTYQHATSNVNFSSVAKTYDFNASGLGGVIKFNNGMASYYDGAGGTSLTY